MTNFEYGSPRIPLGLLVGAWAIWSLYAIWTSGINWQSSGAIATVGGFTAVSLGCLVWAIGAVTGDSLERPTVYRRLMQLFGALGIVFLGGIAFSVMF
ncbi:hypothetical protein [Haladaptatus caseinilyticus]|uniref:hypothetical protein n=1 Tax=Haladaptatus caseinilyticus TaxID=2993314 RepID=UPI00224A801D|nr:hypothetical protein [Haladaptatus caseinilyticus]